MLSMEDFHTMTISLCQVPCGAAISDQTRLPELTAFVDEQPRNVPGILDLAGGTIYGAREVSKGTMITVTLPLLVQGQQP